MNYLLIVACKLSRIVKILRLLMYISGQLTLIIFDISNVSMLPRRTLWKL